MTNIFGILLQIVKIWHQQKRWVFFFDYGPLQDPCEEVSVSASMLLKHRLQLKGVQGVKNDQKSTFRIGVI